MTLCDHRITSSVHYWSRFDFHLGLFQDFDSSFVNPFLQNLELLAFRMALLVLLALLDEPTTYPFQKKRRN